MAQINPEEIPGAWKQGYALDVHTISSEYIGDNQFGHPEFETVRSELGELLYKLKYSGNKGAIEEIVDTLLSFVKKWQPPVDVIVPVPPSNENRRNQPVPALARPLSERLGIELCADGIVKTKKTEELKSMGTYSDRIGALKDAFSIDPSRLQGRNVLLFDDLYRSGATLNAITKTLYNEGWVKSVYALTVTKTRSRS